jgi:GNAT superfamily N-acetyltransferase
MTEVKEARKGTFLLSTDKAKLDLSYIHEFLSRKSYWAVNVPKEIVERSINHSFSVGVYDTDQNKITQCGFARVVTDYATFGYLADVFIDERYRNKRLSRYLMEFIFSMEELKGFRRMILATRDAHGLYAKFGFTLLKSPEKFMEIHRPDAYKTQP